MRRIFGGAALVIGGIAAFTLASRHAPQYTTVGHKLRLFQESALSPTNYDLLSVGAWALVIVGTLLVVTGIIRYSASLRHSS